MGVSGLRCSAVARCAGVVLLFLAGQVLAQPVNDNCADAIPIGNGLNPFSTIGATTDGPVNAGCSYGGQTYADIWYEYTATCTDVLTVSTCSMVNYDSDLAIYEGCDCSNLVFLGCNDDGTGCANFSSELQVPVVAGTCYLIRVGGWNSDTDQGSGNLLIQCGPPSPIGACCLPDNSCTQILEGDCTDAGGSFQGVSAPCVPNPCHGACCATDGSCSETTQADCAAANGIYSGGLNCTDVSCTGACCEPDGTCEILSETQCGGLGGEYSVGADCQSVSCEGSCCLMDNSCVIQTPLGCSALNAQYNGNGTPCTPQLCEEIGPDVMLSNSTSLANYGPVGGIRAVTMGSTTCNVGDMNLLWTGSGTPGLAMNAYRLYDGQLEQIGMSWLKTACCAGATNGCGLPCNGAGGNVLGVGCQDVYGAGYNAIQANMAMRSGVNGFTGTFDPIPGSGSFNNIDRRLQIHESDMNATNYPGALYFLEGMYVATDDYAAGNAYNNASYCEASVSGTYQVQYADVIRAGTPGIYAWRDYGNGDGGMPDPSVHYDEVNVPLEGRYIFGSKVDDLGGGEYRYTYNVFNFNSQRAADGLSVPIPAGTNVTNVGFHDVDYHSGEPYDNTDWTSSVAADSVSWSSPQTYAQNPNTNALRWGTMYTFWFTADVAPGTGSVQLSLFAPGTPSEISATVQVPQDSSVCNNALGDVNGDGAKNGLDVFSFSECLLTGSSTNGNCACANMDGAAGVDSADVPLFVSALLAP